MKLLLRLSVLLLCMLACVGFDQITKIKAQNLLRGHSSISYFDGLLHFVYAENAGTLLGIGSGLQEDMRYILFVLLIGAVLMAVFIFVLVKPMHPANVLALSLIVSGGGSNLIDRVVRDGAVIDFILIKVGRLETGIFNIADIAITLGVCALCLSLIKAKGKGV